MHRSRHLLPILAIGLAAALPSAHADSLSMEHCDKHLLPQPVSLKPGRKYARDRLIDIRHLKLDVTPDFAKRSVSGTASLTFKPIAKPLSQLELDAVDLGIEEVRSTGAQIADRNVTDEKLVLTFAEPIPAGAEASVIVRYHAQPELGLYFRTPEMGYKPGDTQVWSQGEAELHRFWFPSYDFPNERFTSEVICHVPEGMEVVSNGRLVAKTKAADGLVTWHWSQDKEHVNYLVALAAGYFHKLEDKAGALPLALLVPPSEATQAANAFQDTKRILEFYQREIGVPFAWDKYFQVYCLDFAAGGMENTSCTFLNANALYSKETAELTSVHSLDAHETAHQWFGDLVTCRDWSHLWLNEGFASYYTVLYEEEKNGHDAMLYSLWREAQRVLESKDTKPIVWRDYQDPMQQFDYRVYPKGAWVLHMLRSQLGAPLYRDCIRTYLERHRNSVVRTDDLHQVVEELSGLSFDQFFDQWLHHGGQPELKASYSWDAQRQQCRLTISQTQKLSPEVPLFRFPLPVRFWLPGADKPMDFTVTVSQQEEDFYFSLPKQPQLLRIDPDYTVLMKIDFQPPPDMQKRQLKSDVIGRLLAVQQLGGRKDTPSVQQLAEVLKQDGFHAVRSEAARSLKKTGTPEARAALVAGIDQPDARVRKAVVDALSAFPHPQAQEALWKLAATEKNPEILAAVIRTWGARPAEAGVATALQQQLDSRSYRNPPAVAAINALRDQDDAGAAAKILARLQATPLDFTTRDYGGALGALAFLSREQKNKVEALQFLSRHLNDPRQQIRADAARALGELRDPRAIALLRPLTEVRKPFDDPVRDAAEKAVQDLQSLLTGPAELKNLWQTLQQLQKKSEEMEKELKRLKPAAKPVEPVKK